MEAAEDREEEEETWGLHPPPAASLCCVRDFCLFLISSSISLSCFSFRAQSTPTPGRTLELLMLLKKGKPSGVRNNV